MYVCIYMYAYLHVLTQHMSVCNIFVCTDVQHAQVHEVTRQHINHAVKHTATSQNVTNYTLQGTMSL